MTTLTVAGHSVTVSDDFLKLSPEEQHNTVDEIAKSLPSNKASEPSGVIAGFQHGAAEAVRGDASTIGLTGATTPSLDSIASNADAPNYKGASLIKEGGHWYNPSDYQPSALPQILAEQAPGLAQDASAGYLAAKAGALKGPRAAAIAGMGGFAGSALLRTFGPGAHANADARTGDTNSPVETRDLTREATKQAVELPLNMVGGGRLLNGGKLAGSALEKYLKTVGIEAGTGAANDLVDQAATTAGSKEGLNVDLNRTATTALTRAAGSGLLVAPRLASETAANAKYGKIEANPDQQLAAQALAKRQLLIADGRNLVGPLGGTKVAAEAVNGAHTDVHSELAAATKGETLSQDNTNTLSRINSGDKVSPSEVTALAGEATPDTMHLARQAMLSRELRASGNISDDKFTGGLGGAMENLGPIKSPFKTAATTAAAAIAGHAAGFGTLGAIAPVVLGGVAGTYGLARMADKLTGSRSPAQSFQDRFGGTDAPVRLDAPTAPVPEPATTSVPQIAPPQDTALWGNPADKQPTLRATLNSNAKVDEGMAKIAKQLSDQKRKSMISDAIPALQQLAATRQPPAAPPAAPEPPNLSPIALKMLQQQLKAGLPPEPADPPATNASPVQPSAAPVDAFDALKPLMGRQRAVMRGLSAANKQQVTDNAAQRKAAGIAQADSIAADSPAINEQGGLSALSNPDFAKRGAQLLSAANVMRKLTAQPEEAAQAAPVGEVSNAPASPAISALMQKLGATGGPNAAHDTAAPPQPPLIAKITKKMGKPIEEVPHENSYTPMDASQLWGKGLSHEAFAQDDAAMHNDLKYPERYKEGIVRDRKLRQNTIGDVLGDDTGPNAQHAVDLLEELHHTRRADKASGAIQHFTAKMSPAMRAAMRAKLGKGFVSSIWSK